MAGLDQRAGKQLGEMTECSICLNAFTDPRMLPCIHTFCFNCLKRTSEAEQKKPGDEMPCPLCRKEFVIPKEGINGVQKNFFMENLLQYQKTLQPGSASVICDMCNIRNEGKTGQIPTATMRCVECQDNYCDSCVKVHQFQKLGRDHQIVNIGSDTKPEMKRIASIKPCTKHIDKPLDYYCADCKKIVCVSCFVECHSSHKCKSVNSVDKEFRQTIEKKALKISDFMKEMLLIKNRKEKMKSDFLKEIFEKEKEINDSSQKLKDMIDHHTKSLLDEVSVIKSKHLKELKIQMEEFERCCTILSSFEAYCNELTLNGSASDICSSFDQLIERAEELEKHHEAFIGRPHQSVEVTFAAADLREVLQKFNNFVGCIQEATTHFENCAVVVGLNNGPMTTKDVIKINLHQSNETSTLEQIPTAISIEAFAAVYCNTMYVTGIGDKNDEIWKYTKMSDWKKCTSLVQGRRRHSAAFIDEVLYICGGFVDSKKSVIDSVEAYNTVDDKCKTVGKLVHCVQASGNCVPFKSSLYIFGGLDNDKKALNDVQVYNTEQNTCTLLAKRMPRAYAMMRAVLWDTSVISVGRNTCFIYSIETETWQKINQFKTDVVYFGLVLENERIFVIGGGDSEKDKDGKTIWKCRDDVRYVPLQNIIDDKPIEWKIHSRLPKPSFVHAYAKIGFLV